MDYESVRSVENGEQRTLRLEVPGGKEPMYMCPESEAVRIGRCFDCHLVFSSSYVSREHVTLSVEGGRLLAQDMSENGTFLRVDAEGVLDRVQPGRKVPLPEKGILLLGGQEGERIEYAWRDCRIELFEPAMRALKAERYQVAVARFDKLIHIYPSVARAYAYSAYACGMLGWKERPSNCTKPTSPGTDSTGLLP